MYIGSTLASGGLRVLLMVRVYLYHTAIRGSGPRHNRKLTFHSAIWTDLENDPQNDPQHPQY